MLLLDILDDSKFKLSTTVRINPLPFACYILCRLLCDNHPSAGPLSIPEFVSIIVCTQAIFYCHHQLNILLH